MISHLHSFVTTHLSRGFPSPGNIMNTAQDSPRYCDMSISVPMQLSRKLSSQGSINSLPNCSPRLGFLR